MLYYPAGLECAILEATRSGNDTMPSTLVSLYTVCEGMS